MSAETKAALDAALEAHISDECEGALLSGYALQACYFNATTIDRGSTGYFAEFYEGQAYHAGYGLAHHLVDHYRDIGTYDQDDEDD